MKRQGQGHLMQHSFRFFRQSGNSESVRKQVSPEPLPTVQCGTSFLAQVSADRGAEPWSAESPFSIDSFLPESADVNPCAAFPSVTQKREEPASGNPARQSCPAERIVWIHSGNPRWRTMSFVGLHQNPVRITFAHLAQEGPGIFLTPDLIGVAGYDLTGRIPNRAD